MKYRALVQTTATVVIVVFAVGIWSTGGTVDATWLRFFSAAVLAATLVLNVWDRWLWRVPAAQRFRFAPRDIRGTWKGTLTSLWEDPDSGMRPSPKTVFLVVRQTASTVSARLFSDELRSRSTLGKVELVDEQPQLDYIYLGEPDVSVEHRSRIHRGTTSLTIESRPAVRLQGRYWTDRDSKGKLDFTDRVPELAQSYEAATSLFGSRADQTHQ